MNGPFRVIFLDYFGFRHEWVVFTNNNKEAESLIYSLYDYPIKEVVDVYFDRKGIYSFEPYEIIRRMHRELSWEVN